MEQCLDYGRAAGGTAQCPRRKEQPLGAGGVDSVPDSTAYYLHDLPEPQFPC